MKKKTNITNIKKIMNAGYNNVQDILNMSYDDFMKVEGFKEKTSPPVPVPILVRLSTS